MPNINDNSLGTVEAVKKTGVSFERLRYWENIGIIKPRYIKCGMRKFRRYSVEDIRRAVFIKTLVDGEKYSLEGAVHKLQAQNEATLQEKR